MRKKSVELVRDSELVRNVGEINALLTSAQMIAGDVLRAPTFDVDRSLPESLGRASAAIADLCSNHRAHGRYVIVRLEP